MHELGVAGEILDVALSEADRHAAGKVTSIRLRVGVLRAIEPGNLSFLFGHLARGTAAEGALLEIEEEPVRVECGAYRRNRRNHRRLVGRAPCRRPENHCR